MVREDHPFKNPPKLDGRSPANPVNNQYVANAVTLKTTFRLAKNQQLFQII